MKNNLRIMLVTLTLLLPAVSLPVRAEAGEEQQTNEKPRVRPQYEIKLTIYFLNDGKRINHKDYSVVLGHDDNGKIRTLKKVPVELQGGKTEYVETGVKYDINYQFKDGAPQVWVSLIVSGLSAAEGGPAAKSPIDEIQCGFVANLVPGVPTVGARLDAPDSNAGYEIEVTAVPLAVKQ